MSAVNNESAPAAQGTEKSFRKPFVSADGTLVIPFDADPKYHWWIKGGLSVEKIKAELATAEQASAGLVV